MRARLISLLVVCGALGCARTEVLDAPQGEVTATSTSAAGASGVGATTRGTTGTSATSTAGSGTAGTSGTTGVGVAAASAAISNTTGSGTSGTTASVTSSTVGTTGTSGSGSECAPCQASTECAPGGRCFPDASGATFCTAPCLPGNACSDPGSQCIPVGFNGETGCFPQSFSCSPQSTSATATATGTVGTSTGTSAASSTSSATTLGTATATGTVGTSTGTGTVSSTSSTTTTGSVATASATGTLGTSSGTGTVSSSTTSTTTTSGSVGTSTGSTGASTGTTGTTGSDCRTQGCSIGESCNAFPGSAGPYFVCTCTPASAGSPSSCASNPDGTTACDANTLQCRLPRDFERCNRTPGVPTCQGGDVCIFGYCIQPCSTTADCSATFTHCVNRVGQGYCELNRCGPNTANGDYYQPCAVQTPGDGTCQPFADANGQVTGYCLANGPAPTGAPCPGFGIDKAQQCVAGDLCFAIGSPPPDGGTSARCYDTCNANPAGGYPRACSGGSACFTSSPPTSTPDPGVCYP
jgi:hypothetical protein